MRALSWSPLLYELHGQSGVAGEEAEGGSLPALQSWICEKTPSAQPG